MVKSFFFDYLIPRIGLPIYWLVKLFFLPYYAVFCFKYKKNRKEKSVLVLEAGVTGWQSIEFKELYQTASEFLGKDSVVKVEISKDLDYVSQIKSTILEHRPTHYFYDPRTGSQSWFEGFIQSLRVLRLFLRHGIIPIVLLTDFSYRTWRIQSIVVSTFRGCVISFLAFKEGYPLFPHSRVTSPALMPLSKATFDTFEGFKIKSKPKGKETNAQVKFIGSLYEPRTSFLNAVKDLLHKRKIELEIRGRVPGEPRRSDEEYWSVLGTTPIILTTAQQIDIALNDWKWIQQLTYRYLEAMAVGTLLIAPEVPGMRRFFIPGVHFVSYDTEEDAANKIEYYIHNPKERKLLSEKGAEKAEHLIKSNIYWLLIDSLLGSDSLT
ncbi:glycosyltransferase family 1 protein [Leptospira kanakyensis]|uniref:Glycosyltransferase family 1 protein n=1 Tax=Leptospira kanakyensis TaxID=2484968 RepID=A0A6N4Q1A9_9LEPT|nr:glycosyltransferase [Leptospira kanakyensis]TGK51926.1 glycosyltransferase family 1 protein [Leptospira kanakyensis]TGK57166.1 glycosyltransferase family 1 protein [Leptospira kanakyensis]TGK71818.1 glycosyltransferase family 1 protein [Leptospira kanakyensis]